MRARTALAITTLLTLLVGVAAHAAPDLKSQWRDREIYVDGVSEEWDGTTARLKKAKMDVGVVNDGEFLYLSLATDNRGVGSQIMMQGLTVWFDPSGGKEESFGIRFPLGLRNSGGFAQRGRGQGQSRGSRDPERMRQMFEDSTAELEILGSDVGEPTRLPVGDVPGVEVAFDMDRYSGRLVYELKIPLRRDDRHPYSIGIEEEGPIGMGLSSPEMETGGGRGGGRGGGFRGGGGFGGGGGGGGRGGGGFGGGGSGGRPEMVPLDVWTKIQLSTAFTETD